MSIHLRRAPGATRSVALHRRRRCAGVVLLLVLMVVALGSSLSMRFLHVAALRATTSHNLVDSRRAEYMAESGIAEAAFWLAHPELTGNTFWTGTTGRRLDDSQDSYSVTVTRDAANPQKFTVVSRGVAADSAGRTLARTCRAEFLTQSGFPDAIATIGDLVVPSSVTVTGDVYAYNRLDNRGLIDGNVWVGRSFSNIGTITGNTNLNVPLRAIGSYSVTDPLLYWYQGSLCTASVILLDWISNQSLGSGLLNPAGIHSRTGNLHVYGDCRVNGTLVVSGSLHLKAGSRLEITPKPGFPAAVIRNDFNLENDWFTGIFNGTVIVGKEIKTSGSMPNSRLTIRGALVFPNSGPSFASAFSSEPTVVIRHDPSAADVSTLYSSQPNWVAGIRQMSYRQE